MPGPTQRSILRSIRRRLPHRAPARLSAAADESECAGFTVVEMLLVVVILGILIALAIPMVEALRRKSEKAVCISKLRSLHGCFDSYVADNRHWPQAPDYEEEDNYWGFWVSVLAPYGSTPDLWQCPTQKRLLAQNVIQAEGEEESEAPTYQGSYLPTQFDALEFTPYRWNQPWLVERGDYHGDGALLIMPDGSIRSADQVLTPGN